MGPMPHLALLEPLDVHCLFFPFSFCLRSTFYRLLSRNNSCPFLKRVRQGVIARKNRYQSYPGQEHPPVGGQNVILLEFSQKIAQARYGLGYSQPKVRERHFRQDELWY